MVFEVTIFLQALLAAFLQYGLAGLFGGSFILSLIFFPGLVEAIIPPFLFLQFNPYLVFLIATAGSVLGGVVNYMIGKFGSKVLKKKHMKKLEPAEKWLNKWGPFSVFVTAFIPAFPFDIISVAVGLFRMNFKFFFISMLLGKAVKNAMIVFGFEAFVTLSSYFQFF